MATIGQRAFADGAHKYLSIANEEFVRTMKFGNSWKCIRILTRMAVTPNGTSNITGCRLAIGACYSTVLGSTYNAVNTRNFLGILHNHSNESTGLTWTYTANSGNPYYTQAATNGAFIHRYNGATLTTGCNNGQSIIHTNTGSVQRRCAIGCELYKPGATGGHASSLTSKILSCTAAATFSVDFDNAYFRDCMANQILMSGNGTAGAVQYLIPAVADGEGPYPLDSISIFWNQASYPMEIYDLWVIRFT